MKRILLFLLAGALLAALQPLSLAEESPDSMAAGVAVSEGWPNNVGMAGYAVISPAQALEIDQSPGLQVRKPWPVPTYERSGDQWTKSGSLPHKTEVVILGRFPEPRQDGSPAGYLLVEALNDQTRCYISMDHFLAKEERFEAENGSVVSYYLHLPETGDTAEKLPILIYFHGNRDTLDKHHGIGELLRAGQLRTNGIVILPQAVNETTDADFHRSNYQQAVLELAGAVAEKYNGDLNRLSVSGHSDGGTTVYQIVNRNPGVFAACAPISAIGTTGDGIKQLSLWVFQGHKDFWVKESVGLRVVLKCEAAGCNAMHYIYKTEGHDIQTMVFRDTFPDENGQEVKLVDWLMSKSLQ